MNSNGYLQVRAQSADYRRCISFLLMTEKGFAEPIVITASETYENVNPPPTFELSIASAQLLMDDLWQAGIRPSEGTGSAGALLATQKHLEDMRKLVFDTSHTKKIENISGDIGSKYNELIYAVCKKFPNESRHETALRYILERERAAVDAPAKEHRL